MIKCSGVHVESGKDLTGIAMTGGNLLIGTSVFSCTAGDVNGRSGPAGGSWTIEVDDHTTLDIVVQLSPPIKNSALTRAIDFELFSDCRHSPKRFTRDLRFSGVFQRTAHIRTTVKTDQAGQFACITARDPLHTLTSVAALTCHDGVYSAVFKADPSSYDNWLIGGNLGVWRGPTGVMAGKGDVIEIFDFAQFVARFGTCPGADTPKGTPGPHADINGDGCVDSLDFSFINRNFLMVSDHSCCYVECSPPLTFTEISVSDLQAYGLGELTIADLNGDGMVNGDDMAAFAAGEVPIPFRRTDSLHGPR